MDIIKLTLESDNVVDSKHCILDVPMYEGISKMNNENVSIAFRFLLFFPLQK